MSMSKSDEYYSSLNVRLLKLCPEVPRVLEFGCGAGRLMAAYRETNPEAYCVGVEQVVEVAEQADKVFDQVICADAESVELSEYGLGPESFDLIIYGDVLEHFVDPWGTLSEHLKYLRPGGSVCACIPNSSHWSIIVGLLNGKFDYQHAGLLDRTHLRFFTYSSMMELLSQAGLEPITVNSFMLNNARQHRAMEVLGKAFGGPDGKITHAQQRDWCTFQYLVRAVKPTVS